MSAADPQAGDIFVGRHDEHQRCIVYGRPKRGSVYYVNFPSMDFGGGAVCHGLESGASFLRDWRYEATMGFGGAFKRIRKLQRENLRLRNQLATLALHVDAVHQMAAPHIPKGLGGDR